MTTDIIRAISHGPFTATPTGLLVDDTADIPYELWDAYGRGLQRVEAAVQWVIGDWLNFGSARYGEKYSQAIDSKQADTWRHYAWVANKVPRHVRVSTLSWSHHREVAHLPEDEQAAMLYLAQERELSVRQLGAFANGHDPDNPFRPDEWRALWKAAATKWWHKWHYEDNDYA